eukprot:gene34459-38955_t
MEDSRWATTKEPVGYAVDLCLKLAEAVRKKTGAKSMPVQFLQVTPANRIAMVETGKAAQVFSFGQTGYAPGLQLIGAVVKAGQPLEPVRDELIAAVEGFAKTPPTEDEMERVRRNIGNSIEKALNDPQKVGVALSEQIALGDWRLLFLGRDSLPKVTPQQVAKAAAHYLKRDNRTVG